MKKFLYQTVFTLSVLSFWLGMYGVVLAESDLVSVSISASIVLGGAIPEAPDSFEIRLAPADENAPVPGGGTDILTIRGAGQGAFPEITYTQPGIYRYTIYQLPGTAACAYDEERYYLTVTVINGEHGLECAAVLYQDNENSKLELPVFYNVYPAIPQQTETQPETEKSEKPTESEETENPPETEKPGNPAESEETETEEPKDPAESETIKQTENQTEKPQNPAGQSSPKTPSGNTPSGTSTSGLVPTGVRDRWPVYAAGIVILLIIAGAMIRVLRKDDNDDSPAG